MKKYRIWVKDITLQSLVVEAESARKAKELAEHQIAENEATFEPMEEGQWEVSSVEAINE